MIEKPYNLEATDVNDRTHCISNMFLALKVIDSCWVMDSTQSPKPVSPL